MPSTFEISSPDSSAASILRVEVPFKRTVSSNLNNAKKAKTDAHATTQPLTDNAHVTTQPKPNALAAHNPNSLFHIPPPMMPTSAKTSTTKPPAQKKKKVSEMPHVLLWICTHGKGRSNAWTRSSLKVIGVYATKDDAEEKKGELMNRYDTYGHGDICVGGTWMDEIDLVIRPAEEVCL